MVRGDGGRDDAVWWAGKRHWPEADDGSLARTLEELGWVRLDRSPGLCWEHWGVGPYLTQGQRRCDVRNQAARSFTLSTRRST